MPAIIDSAPDCIPHIEGATAGRRLADFILQKLQDAPGS